ncbi:unnamed protein product [Amaranthus hypochondriacus]
MVMKMVAILKLMLVVTFLLVASNPQTIAAFGQSPLVSFDTSGVGNACAKPHEDCSLLIRCCDPGYSCHFDTGFPSDPPAIGTCEKD